MDLLSAIQGAGEAVDKVTGGRAVRGLMAGKPRELLSPIPFSDSMGLTDHKDSTSGRDLTNTYGLTDPNSNSFGSHAAGFLADNVLSPANMLGGYAAFKTAPTLAKGVTSGAKALSGLDMFEHLANAGVATAKGVSSGARAIRGAHPLAGLSGAGRSAGNFLGDEAGYLKVPLRGIPEGLAEHADAIGPMYPGGLDKLMRIADSTHDIRNPGMPSVPRSGLSDSAKKAYLTPYDRIMGLANSEYASRIAGEIPGGSSYLGHGLEAMAFRTPSGNVIRVADNSVDSTNRLNLPEVLQPYRHATIGPYTVEHLPFVDKIPGGILGGTDEAKAMRSRLRSREYDPWDVAGRNMGITHEGNYVIHDGGAVSDLLAPGARGIDDPYRSLKMPSGDLLEALIKIGSPEAVRNAISAGASLGTRGQGVSGDELYDILSRMRQAS